MFSDADILEAMADDIGRGGNDAKVRDGLSGLSFRYVPSNADESARNKERWALGKGPMSLDLKARNQTQERKDYMSAYMRGYRARAKAVALGV